MEGAGPQPFVISVPDQVLAELGQLLGKTRWPAQPVEEGWELGVDLAYLRELCDYWASSYDWPAFEAELGRLASYRWRGLHLWHLRTEGEGLPLMLIHGWPGGPIEFLGAIPRLLSAGHDLVVPSLPGYAWSEDPGRPLNAAAVSVRLRELMEQGLGYRHYGVQGGDWGALISTRMAFDSPQSVSALHVNALSLLPVPGNLAEPPLSEEEQAFIERGQRWRRREGNHLFVQSSAPDALAVGLADSPAGLAAWLVGKYRRWSDCGGDLESRFSKDDLCGFLTMYWATGTIASSMRLYLGERRNRWRLGPEDRVEVPCAVADFPAELVRAPREWGERFLSIRRFTEMPRGGHFAAFEEPELFAEDVAQFLAELGP